MRPLAPELKFWMAAVMMVGPLPARVRVRPVLELSERLTGLVLKVSEAPPVRLLTRSRLPPLFWRLKVLVELPLNSKEAEPAMSA